MALSSHTVGQMVQELQNGLDAGDFQADDTLAVKLRYDRAFVDHLAEKLGDGSETVDLLPLSVEATGGPLWVTIVANATKDA